MAHMPFLPNLIESRIWCGESNRLLRCPPPKRFEPDWMSKFLLKDEEGVRRCWWCGADTQYVLYHDTEWGTPVKDDRRLYEKICLEGFQAGLSWLTILRKRESFRDAFDGFEIESVAKFTQRNVTRLLENEGIVRHRGKIEATISNARRALELQEEKGSLAEFFWSFQPKKARKFDAKRAITSESKEMSKQLRKRGWRFVGPTTCYSFVQSMGIVNDHHPGCLRFDELNLNQ